MDNPKQENIVNSDDPISLLSRFIGLYKKFLADNNYHKRLCQAMKNIGRHYSDIISTEHSGDIKNIVGGFYSSFLKSIIHIIENPYSKDIDNSSEYVAPDFFENLNEALEKFRNLFGNFLFDILRSDHAFFEMPSTAHPSIGSTTKLLLAYNKIINDWNDSIKSLNNHHRISFLVTSGGCDTTQAHNLLYKFEDKIPVVDDTDRDVICVPVIITIPEASLFDIKGTLFRLAHEFFHLKGNRTRDERFRHYYKGVFYEYIDYCCNYIKTHNALFVSDTLDSVVPEKISAINFKNYIETSTGGIKNKNIEKYFALKNILKEFNSSSNLSERELKNYKDDIDEAFDTAIFIHSVGYLTFKQELDKFSLDNKKSATNDLKSSFEKNFYYDSQKEKVIDVFNVKICSLLDETFKKYDLSKLDADDDNLLLSNLNKIFELVPFNAISYASHTATYIPQLIGELSDIYTKIEYGLRDNIRKNTIEKYGLIYDAYYGGKDKYNVFGFEEYPNDNGSGIKNLPSHSDTYARLWIRASIEFFLAQRQGEFYSQLNSYNMNDYNNLFGSLYKECFADACAINSYKRSFVDAVDNDKLGEELIALYISAFLFEHRDVDQLFNIKQLRNSDVGELLYKINNSGLCFDFDLVVRFAVTIACVIGNDEGSNIKFNTRNVVSRVVEKVGNVLIQNRENGDKKGIERSIKLILLIIKRFYNGSNNTTKVNGLKNYIYVQELIVYVKDAMGKDNYVNYPKFTDNDYENVGIILDKWLGSYDKTVCKGNQ